MYILKDLFRFPVFSSGPIIAGHIATWLDNEHIQDGGSPSALAVAKPSMTQIGSVSTTTAEILYANSIPTNTAGVQLLTASITPVSASSLLKVSGVIHVASAVATKVTIALFQGSSTTAFYAGGLTARNANDSYELPYIAYVVAGSTSSVTISLRIGNSDSTSTITINGTGGSAEYGGVQYSTMIIEELPQ